MAASTAEDICNLALGHLGEAPIVDIDDNNTRAAACKERYDTTLDATLRAHRWNFAKKRALVLPAWVEMDNLTVGASSVLIEKQDHGLTTGQRVRLKDTTQFDGVWPVTASECWEFTLDGAPLTSGATVGSYALSPPFGWSYQYALPSDCLRVLELNDSEEGDNLTPWEIESGHLLTEAEECRLVYIARVSDVTKFDALFVDAFALSLAIRLTEIIRGATSKTEQLTAQYERITAPLARRIDANETRRRKPLKPLNSLAIQARFRHVTG